VTSSHNPLKIAAIGPYSPVMQVAETQVAVRRSRRPSPSAAPVASARPAPDAGRGDDLVATLEVALAAFVAGDPAAKAQALTRAYASALDAYAGLDPDRIHVFAALLGLVEGCLARLDEASATGSTLALEAALALVRPVRGELSGLSSAA
jgi:hypothetical protein